MKNIFFIAALFIANTVAAQLVPDSVYQPNIHTIKLFQQNNQESLPIINLNSSDLIELHFDDFDGYIKNYYYTYVLCNADWSETDINSFDYIKGFTQNRLTQARPSSITLSKYVHYQATLPEKNCVPTKAGNYLLKVFLNGDVDNVVFTKRMYVVNSIAACGMQIMQPFDGELSRTHQKVNMNINIAAIPNVFSPNENIKITLLQNQRWDNAKTNIQPTFIRGNSLEYNDERQLVFEAGNEYRWADLRSFRFESDKILRKDVTKNPIDVFMKPEGSRLRERYLLWKDLNGWYDVSTTEMANPWWQTDYANVHFTYVPQGNQPFAGKSVYIMGEFTNNNISEENKMEYNAEKGIYEKTLLLKQGYYSYCYATKDNKPNTNCSFSYTEGNYWETENVYTLFVYYRAFGARYDELIGTIAVNSKLGKLY